MGKTAIKRAPKSQDGINPRQPCPCGSGKRYKACHGAISGPTDVLISRPFEGLAAECELIALREFVPTATVPLPVKADREVVLGTVLPIAAAALVREDGTAYVGMQVQTRSGDISRDIARAIGWALRAEPGSVLSVVGPDDGSDPGRLQDLLPADAVLEPELHKDFGWWVPEGTTAAPEVALSLERANSAILPTERIGGLRGAYWVDAGEKAHLRWVRPEPEEQLLAALARLGTAGELTLGEDTRFAGEFRAHGLLVPVWDLDREMHPKEWVDPATALGERITTALASLATTPLTDAERRTRDGLLGRQITLR